MKTLREIQVEQHAWSLKNFGPHGPDDPLDGLIEEFGELHHAVLKRRQGIRGTAEEHDAAERDALGDMMIYLLDLLSTQDECAPEMRDFQRNATPAGLRREMLSAIESIANALEQPGDDMLWIFSESLCELMSAYCEARGWSLLEIVNETWEQVSKRKRGEGELAQRKAG